MSAQRCVVNGRVQGVGFRWWVQRVANELELQGWARNLDDGSVEIFVQGPLPSVARLLDLVRSESPGAVDSVQVDPASANSELVEFGIRS